MDYSIRLASLDDAPTLAEFNAAMALETERLELEQERLLGGVEAVLRDPAKGFYLVADEDGSVTGQLMVTFEWSDWRNGVFWWVQSVYVRPDRRGGGIYTALYKEAVRRAQAQGDVCGLRLYVEKDNARAQAAYNKLGMSETDYLLFETDFVLAR